MAKFSVGEKVLLRSKSTPERNGTYTILDRWYKKSSADHEDDGTCYSVGVAGRSGFDYWYESALRPLPKFTPATDSFSDMMDKFNTIGA